MEPTTAEDWMAVANDRAMDAEAIEDKREIPTPTFGKEGHNLHELSGNVETRYIASLQWIGYILN